MSTYYIPTDTSWSGYGSGGTGYIRFVIDQTYNASSNTSSLSIGIQVYLASNAWSRKYYFESGTFSVNGAVKQNFSNDQNYTMLSSDREKWVDIGKNGVASKWTQSVSHNADGTATVTIAINSLRLYNYAEDARYITLNTNSGSADISQTRTFTLSISAGTGSSITVKKGSTTLSNGASITYGDSLTITIAANTGYNLNTSKVNGSNFTSGNTHTVTGAVSVTSTATIKSFTLSISTGTHTTITVNRTSSPIGKGSTGNLSSGTTIYYNDVLKISFATSTGCTLSKHTVNGSTFTSGNSHTVTAAVSVVSSATVNSYSLSLTTDSYVNVSVNRTSSPVQGAAEGYLSNGATIYYGDILSITYTANTGYRVNVATLNGTSFNSGTNHTVLEAVSLVVNATAILFTITQQIETGANLTIYRTSSPNGGGATGVLTGNTVYYGDVLILTATFDSGYGAESMSINDVEYLDNPHSVTVVENITIVIIAKALGFVYIDTGSTIEKYKILIDNGSAYEQYRAMIDTGSEIVPY